MASDQKNRWTDVPARVRRSKSNITKSDKKPLRKESTSKTTLTFKADMTSKRKLLAVRVSSKSDINIQTAIYNSKPRPASSTSAGQGPISSTMASAARSIPGYLQPTQAFRDKAKVEVAAPIASRVRNRNPAARRTTRPAAASKSKSEKIAVPTKTAPAKSTTVATPTPKSSKRVSKPSIPAPTFSNTGAPRRHGRWVAVPSRDSFKESVQDRLVESRKAAALHEVSDVLKGIATLRQRIAGLLTKRSPPLEQPTTNAPSTTPPGSPPIAAASIFAPVFEEVTATAEVELIDARAVPDFDIAEQDPTVEVATPCEDEQLVAAKNADLYKSGENLMLDPELERECTTQAGGENVVVAEMPETTPESHIIDSTTNNGALIYRPAVDGNIAEATGELTEAPCPIAARPPSLRC
jgi:hypothetical protein